MTRTLYVHVGLHKTGTTYLQNVVRANRAGCATQGVQVPGGPGGPVTSWAVWDFQGRRPRGGGDPRAAGQWDALVASVASSELPRTLLSEERLSLCTRREAASFIDAFADCEPHVIVTVRDLGRVIPSAWQEEIKNGASWTWSDFVTAIKDPARRSTNPARGFWLRQDVVRICRIWAAKVGPSRVHVVTVPPSGAGPDELLRRFCSVVGLDAGKLTETPRWNNENLGAAATEVLRRVNVEVGRRLDQRQYDEVVKRRLVPELARTLAPESSSIPAVELAWLEPQAQETIAALEAAGYDLVGDVADLLPVANTRRRVPDAYTDPELADAAVQATAILTERYSHYWLQTRRRERREPGLHAGSRIRAARFQTQRWASDLADRNAAAAKVFGWAMRVRDRSPRG